MLCIELDEFLLYQVHEYKVKCKRPHLGFEHGTQFPLPTMIYFTQYTI